MGTSAAEITVENIVGTIDSKRELDLDAIDESMPGAEYDPVTFSGLLYTFDNPDVTVELFRTGQIVCTGARSRAELDYTAQRLVEKLQEIGIHIDDYTEPSVENIVASTGFDTHVELSALALDLGLENVEYEPEQFAALIYRPETVPFAVALIFSNSKTVILGCKSLTQVNEAVDIIEHKLTESVAVGTVY